MDENPWNVADMAMAAVRLQQHVLKMLVAKGVVTEGEAEDMVNHLIDQTHLDPGASGVAKYLERAFGIS